MTKLFVFADCHGYYDELIKALDEKGFEAGNPEHLLVGLGDYFDRGKQPFQVMRYLNSVPNKVLCLGNHEELVMDCIERGYPERHDWHNGTTQTIINLSEYYDVKGITSFDFAEACQAIKRPIQHFFDQMVNYFETENYVFVHSSIPAICKDNFPKYYTYGRSFEYDPDWRNADKEAWDNARWGQPFDMVERGIVPEGKTLVFGHWHTSYMWAQDEGRSEFGEDAKFEPYFGNGFIGVDCCTALSGKVGVVVLEDNLLSK